MPALSQIALSVADLERLLDWYERVLGLRRSGSTRLFRGRAMERITGIPDPVSRCAWMVDSQHRFQLELFEFARPLPRRRRRPDAPAVGYSSIVASLPGATPGSLTDPDGNEVRLIEGDPREPRRNRRRTGASACAFRGIVATVPDLARSRRFFGDVLGLREAADDVRFGTDTGNRTAFWAQDVLLELLESPDAEPWRPGRCLSDIGVLNVAFAASSGRAHRDLCRRIATAGYELTSRPARLGLGSVVYVTDDQGFSVELVHLSRFAARRLGYFE